MKPILVIRKIWEEVGLEKIIKKVCGNEDVAERTFVLTSCRLTSPQSEHGLFYFLDRNSVSNIPPKNAI